ncbi:MAG: Fic family protein [Nocardioides sp.]|uniref:Fic family protein n=1 Tax=Nocardioides sp. TaxID=35761 RepID=UPI0039E24590
MIPDFYSRRPDWPGRIEQIVELLGRISAVEELSGRVPELRRTNRINSVHSSTAIEGNELTLAQVEDVANGEPVFAPPREVKEVENALAAYDALGDLDPWSVDDFLRAHGLLTVGLQPEAGVFRTVDVEIVHPDGTVLHTGSRVAKVPRLVTELMEWGSASADHPLIVSSAAHFLIEHIHPFRDGNGRIGRLWQTLILSRWRPVFAWMPTETLIRQEQEGYYQALQASREPEIDAAVFIDYMLGVITESLASYEARAKADVANVGVNVGANVGVTDSILLLLRGEPTLSAAAIADRLGKTSRTVERHLADLKAEGRVRRVGSAKAGWWVVVES